MSPALAAELEALGVRNPKPKPAPKPVNREPCDPWWKRGEECPH